MCVKLAEDTKLNGNKKISEPEVCLYDHLFTLLRTYAFLKHWEREQNLQGADGESFAAMFKT